MPSCDNSSLSQTLFLGLSIQSVSMNMGWNGQQSNISVTLIEDTCKPAAGRKKVYYPRPGSTAYWNFADPGFQTPTIGAPVYFRFEDFEFAGIVQSWDLKDSPSGKIYSVSIADPRLLLENLTVIISDYADNVGSIPNLINPYGYLESLGFPCAQQFINGASFGSPAGAFGGANNNDQGTPYNLLRDATQALLCGVSNPKFSPYGFARYRGNNPVQGGPSMGIIPADDFDAQVIADYNGNGYGASYYVDISDIPFAPQYFRLAGPQDTLMNMISNVCTIAGCDFYIELLITPSLTKIIKVRTSKRKQQPTLGVIDQYLANATLDVTQRDIGRELRNENTSSFLYGGYLQTVYEQGEPNATSEANNSIIQHWGYDSEGILNNATHNAGTNEWTVTLDLRPLNINLIEALGANTVEITETEFRCAIGEFDTWKLYCLSNPRTPLGDLIVVAHPGVINPVNGLPFAQIGAVGAGMAGPVGLNLNDDDANNINSDASKDLKKIHEFITDFANELYGKKFLVRLPFVCFQTDSDSGKKTYSDNPTSNGGYPARDITDVLTLPFPSTGLDFFSSKEQLVLPFAYFDTEVTGAFPKSPEDTIIYNSDLFIKATVDEKIIDYNTLPAALVTITAPIEDNTGNPAILEGLDIIIKKVVPGNEDIVPGLALENEAGKIGNVTLAACHRRRTPDAASVPMISNTDRYGPYGYQGPSGPVAFQAADNIVPWNFGGYTTMDVAAAEQAKDGVTYMQVGEKGSITFVGSPRHRLGQEIKSSIESFSNVAGQTASVTVGGNTFSFQKFPMSQWVGDLGPSITSISISIGSQGVTTTYTLSTFSPTFGKMAKYNANRLSILGKHRQEIQRTERDRLKLSKQMANAEGKADRALANIKAEQQHRKNIQGGSNEILTASLNTGSGVFDGKKNASSQSAKGSQLTNSPKQSGVAAASMDSMVVPISKSGDSDLPRYAIPVSGCSGSGGMSTPGTTPQMDPPIAEWTEPITNISYLDPFYTPSNPKHTTEDPTEIHTDVRIMAHDTPENKPQLDMVINESSGGVFPEDVRVLAHKGPLMLHGWGYDTEGKPVPNIVDDPTDARGGIFKSEGLKDTFLTGWLSNQDTWPVAPVDLRFDRTRAVWTVPNQFRIGIATATGSGENGAGATIKNLTQTYDSDGEAITSGSITYAVPSGMTPPKTGETFFAFYDNVACTYYPLMSSPSSGSSLSVISSGCEASGSGDYEAGGSGYPFPSISDVTNLVLGRGLALSTVCLSGANTGTGGCAEGLGSSNFMNDPSGTHSAVIELNLSITGQSNFCSGEASGTGGFLESLTFGSGFILSKDTGSGCGDFTVDPILQRLSHFTCTGGSGEVQNAVYSGLLFSTGIAVENSGDCTYAIVSDIRISNATGICNTGTDIPVSGQRFTNLTFGTGLNVTSGDNECSFNIDADHYIGYASGCSGNETGDFNFFNKLLFSTGLAVSNVSGCTYSIASTKTLSSENCGTGTGFSTFTGVPYENLKFSSGLGVTQSGCNYTIQSTLSVSDGEYCDHSGEELISSSPFEHLEFGSGLYLNTGTGQLGAGCGFSVHADHSIKSTATCGAEPAENSPSGDYAFFNKLNFSSGLQVTGSGCEFTISSTNTITGEATCGNTGQEGGFYNNLIIGSGLALEASEDCGYKISSDFKVGSSGVCGNDAVAPESVTTLIMGTGLKYVNEGAGSCTGTISSDIKVKDESTCATTSEVVAYKLFSKLNFKSGLTLEESDDCEYNINVNLLVDDEATCGDVVNMHNKPFQKITARSGLRFITTDLCEYKLDVNLEVNDEATCGDTVTVTDKNFKKITARSGLKFEEASNCEYKLDVNLLLKDEATCNESVSVTDKPFKKITARSGLTIEEGANCEFKIDSNRTISHVDGCVGNEVLAPTLFNNLIFNSGLKVNSSGDCNYSISTDITISSTGSTLIDSDSVDNQFFKNLSFTSGLGVKDLGDCVYEVFASGSGGAISLISSSGCSADGPHAQSTQHLVFSTGLGVTQNLVSPNSWLIEGPKISGIGSCGADNWGGKSFDTLTFGSGFKNSGTDCNPIIDVERYISTSGECGTEAIPEQFFKKLLFGTGMEVLDEGDCAFKISSAHKLKDEAYCDYSSPTVAEHTSYTKLNFSSGLKITGSACEFGIVADHSISDIAYCEYSPEIPAKSFFTNIAFGSGLQVTGDDCSYGVNVSRFVQDSGYCGYTPTVASDKQYFETLIFGSGLKVSGGSCDFTIDADHRISGIPVCGSPSVPDQLFKLLSFGTGIEVEDKGDCEFTISSSRRISKNTCDNTLSIDSAPFNLLYFSTGIDVELTGSNCDYIIKSAHKITDSSYCSYSPSISNKPYEHLKFGSGLQVTGTGCEYSINVDRSIRDDGYCNYTPTVLEGTYYNKLVFGTGLKVTGNASDCTYGIDADHSISATGSTSVGRDTSIDGRFFRNLSFTSGLGVRDLGDCSYEIWAGPKTIRDDSYCNYTNPTVLEGTTFDKLIFGTGLKVTGSNSEYGIDADHSISATGTTLVGSEYSISSEFFNNLSFTSGLGVRSLGGCSYEIWSSGSGGGSSLISNTGCSNTGAYGLAKQASSHLVFSTGLKVSEKTDEANAWFIEGPKVSGLASCTSQAGAGGWGGNPFNMLVFGSGFSQYGGTDCQPIVHASQYVSGSGDCNNDFPRSFFNELVFTTGINIKSGEGEDTCSFIVSGPKVSGLDADCTGSLTGWGGQPFDTLTFGTGLRNLGTDCNPIIDASTHIKNSAACGRGVNTEFQHFSGLIMGTGLTATGTGDCSFEIFGPRISGLASCTEQAGGGDWGGNPFNMITFGTGFSKFGSDCNPIINAPQYISGSGDCGNEFTRSFFNELIFTTGTNIQSTENGDNCSFLISGPRVSGIGSCYAGGGAAGAGNWGGMPFQQLTFGTGFSQSGGTDCNPIVHAAQYVSGSGCDGALDFSKSFFHDLIFTTGIHVAGTGGDDPCSFFISGPKISGEKWCDGDSCEGGDCLAMDITESPFSKLIVSTGLSLTTSGCGVKVLTNPMKVLQSVHCLGTTMTDNGESNGHPYSWLQDSDGESFTELNFGCGITSKYYPEMCSHDIFLELDMTGVERFKVGTTVDCDPLSGWVDGTASGVCNVYAGPGVYIKGRTLPGEAGKDGCIDSIFHTNFAVKGLSGECGSMSTETFDYLEHLELGCGLLLEASSETVCGDKEGVKISINPNAGRPADQPCHLGEASGVTVVRDVCCTGDDLTVRYTTLNFSSCGLFTHLSNDDGICECEGC